MIYTERKVSIKNDIATIDSPIILFRGDREVEIMFTIVDSKFKFESNKGNVIDKTQAAFGQLAVALPDGTDLFTEIVETQNGVVVFSITGEMIDEIHEVGFYSFHIRLYNDDKTSRITLPPVMEGIEIREPLIIEGDVENTDLVGDATVGYSMVQAVGADEEVFDEDGNYIPTLWGIGDKITAEKLNKMEEGIAASNTQLGGEDSAPDQTLTDIENDITSIKSDITSIQSSISLSERYHEGWYLGDPAEIYYYAEPSSYTIWVKWEQLTRFQTTTDRIWQWQRIKANIDPNKFSTSPEGVTDCLRLDYYDLLVYDIVDDDIYLVAKATTFNEKRHVILIHNEWGRMEAGALFACFAGVYLSDTIRLINQSKNNVGPSTIKNFWESTIDNKISTINTMHDQGVDVSSFIFMTDNHSTKNAQELLNFVANANHIKNKCNIDLCFIGGDILGSEGKCTEEETCDTLKWNIDTLQGIDNVLMVEGNHDPAYDLTTNTDAYYRQNIQIGKFYNMFYRKQTMNKNVVFGDDGTYFYVDDRLNKIRFICLNSTDLTYVTEEYIDTDGTKYDIMATQHNKMKYAAIRQTQLDFVVKALTDIESDYSVIVISHVPLPPYATSEITGDDRDVVNGDILIEVLRAFKNKTEYSGSTNESIAEAYKVSVQCDFTDNKGGTIIACIAGHTHYDNVVMYNDIPFVTTLNFGTDKYLDSPAKAAGTSTESAFDIFTINTNARTVNITRIGAGSDRNFTY